MYDTGRPGSYPEAFPLNEEKSDPTGSILVMWVKMSALMVEIIIFQESS